MQKDRTRNSMMRVIVVAFGIILMVSMTSCALFKGKTEPDLAPFAEQTIIMAGNVNHGFAEIRTIYLREEAARSPEAEELRDMVGQIRIFMRGIVAYSLQVVTLSQSSKTGPERAEALADFIEELLDPVVEQKDVELHYQEVRFDEILSDIREQETLIDALRVGQPLVDEAAYVAGAFLDDFKDKQMLAAQSISDSIDAEFYAIISYENILREQEELTLELHERLTRYALGDESALEAVKEEIKGRKSVTFEGINIEDGLDTDELFKVEERILGRLNKIATLRSDIEPELAQYRIKQRELDKVIRQVDKSLMETRATIFIWNKTHLKMSEGLTHPATISLFTITEKLMDTAIQEIPVIPIDIPF